MVPWSESLTWPRFRRMVTPGPRKSSGKLVAVSQMTYWAAWLTGTSSLFAGIAGASQPWRCARALPRGFVMHCWRGLRMATGRDTGRAGLRIHPLTSCRAPVARRLQLMAGGAESAHAAACTRCDGSSCLPIGSGPNGSAPSARPGIGRSPPWCDPTTTSPQQLPRPRFAPRSGHGPVAAVGAC